MGKPKITVIKRADDWVAHKAGDARVWESGKSYAEAIGFLALRLGLAEMPK